MLLLEGDERDDGTILLVEQTLEVSIVLRIRD